MAALSRDLVDANVGDRAEVAVGQSVVDDVGHGVVDRAPRAPKQGGNARPRKLFGPRGQEHRQGHRHAPFACGPGHGFDIQPATPTTLNPARGVEQPHRHSPQRHVVKASHRPRVTVGPGLPATPTTRPVAPVGDEYRNQFIAALPHIGNTEALQRQRLLDQLSNEHEFLPG